MSFFTSMKFLEVAALFAVLVVVFFVGRKSAGE
jgi:hypothetical protein